jgi:dihydroceramide fatty acyl 2-hydroxylase
MPNTDKQEHSGQQAVARPTTTRMFKSDFIEYFSRIHPITPFVVWLPVVLYVLQRNLRRPDASLTQSLLLVLAGFFIWTLTEYGLHRYVFHWINETPFGKRFHFLIHGVHHDFPQDKDRLVMPVGASAPMAVIFYAVFWLAFGGARLCDPFFAGFALGYLFYDGSHFAIHHYNFKWAWFRKVKRHHMLHHHHGGGYGVSTPFWDHVFGSLPSLKKTAH